MVTLTTILILEVNIIVIGDIMRRIFSGFLILILLLVSFPENVEAAAATQIQYYINTNDLMRLYSSDEYGNIKKLSDRIVDRAWETRNYLYFTVVEGECFPRPYGREEYGLFRIKKDGSDEIFIDRFDTSDWEFLFNDNYVCYFSNEVIGGYEVGDYARQNESEYYDRETIYVSDDVLRTLKPVSLSDDYVYFTNNDNNSYRVYFHRGENVYPYKPKQVNKMPKASQKAIKKQATDMIGEKAIAWKSVKNADHYIISKLDPATGKYTKIAETNNTKINIYVPSKEFNAEYKITAAVNGKYYKTECIDYVYDESFCGFASSELFTIDLNGKNKNIIKTFDVLKNNGLSDEASFLYTDKAVYVKYPEDITDVDYGDSLFRYDFSSGTVQTLIEGEMFSPDYYDLLCFANDRIIYKYKNYLCTVDKTGNRRFIVKLNYRKSHFDFQLYNDRLYYNDKGLCSINIDGSGFKKYFTSDKIEWQFVICDDMLYYVKNDDNYKRHIYKCTINGKEDVMVIDDEMIEMYIDNKYLYFSYDNPRIWERVAIV